MTLGCSVTDDKREIKEGEKQQFVQFSLSPSFGAWRRNPGLTFWSLVDVVKHHGHQPPVTPLLLPSDLLRRTGGPAAAAARRVQSQVGLRRSGLLLSRLFTVSPTPAQRSSFNGVQLPAAHVKPSCVQQAPLLAPDWPLAGGWVGMLSVSPLAAQR